MLRVSGHLVAAIAVVLCLASCSLSTPAPSPTPSPIPSATPTPVARTGDGVLRIGTLFPSSGALKFLGPAQQAGVAAAVREINAAGGVLGKPVKVIAKDSGDAGSKTSTASLAALIAAKADVVIGPSSSALVQQLLPAAAKAQVALVSPAATFPGLAAPANADYFDRTIAAYDRQGAALAQAIGAKARGKVALIYSNDAVGSSLAQSLPDALGAAGGAVVASVPIGTTTKTVSGVVAKVVAAHPSAVVLATEGGATDQNKNLIKALVAAKLGGSALWLTSQNLADYSRAIKKGRLTNVNGVLEGANPNAAFLKKLKKENDHLKSTLYAAEAYDATMLAALAASVAGDDGHAAVAGALRGASVDGITCASWAECVQVLKTDSDINYAGVSGPLDLMANGDTSGGYYGVYRYSNKNKYARVATVLVR